MHLSTTTSFPNTVSVPFLLEAIPYHPAERARFLLRTLRPCICHSSHTGRLLLRVRAISLHVHASQLLTPDYKRSFLIKYPDVPNERPCSHCLFSLSKCPESLFQPDHPQFLLHCFWNLPGITKWSNETHLLTTHVLWPICNPCLKPKSNPKLIFLILDTSGRLESAFLYSKHEAFVVILLENHSQGSILVSVLVSMFLFFIFCLLSTKSPLGTGEY